MRLPIVLTLVLAACSDGPTPPAPPPCDTQCRDANALRAVRETVKLAFNLTLQGKAVGEHDATVPCIRGGTARVFGTATSNPDQGATFVKLTYVLTDCAYLRKDTEAHENYDMTLRGTLTQEGTIAVQPSATTALVMKSDKLTLTGTVYAPPQPYDERDCPLDIAQDGNRIFGKLCTRDTSFTF